MTLTKTGRRLGTAAALVAATSMTAPSFAQDSVNSGSVSFALGFDVVTQYFFRGYEQEDSGLIFQPYVEVGVSLYEGDDAINSIDLTIGSWNSWHGNETGAAASSSPAWWYESDIYAGISVGLFDVVGFDLTYVGYFYPGGSLDDIHELDLTFSFDDSAYTQDMFGSALNPYILFAFEVDDRGGDNNSYLELGIGPSWTIVDSADYPVTLDVPLTVGLSLDDYYADEDGNDEFFGFFQIGADFSTPLAFVPAEYGSWSAHAGVFLTLKGEAELFDSSSDGEVWASFGVGMEY